VTENDKSPRCRAIVNVQGRLRQCRLDAKLLGFCTRHAAKGSRKGEVGKW